MGCGRQDGVHWCWGQVTGSSVMKIIILVAGTWSMVYQGWLGNLASGPFGGATTGTGDVDDIASLIGGFKVALVLVQLA